MQIIYNTCDHCGKKITGLGGWTDADIEGDLQYIVLGVDLCCECKEKLITIIKNFVKEGGKAK